jgi:hypothetical protein
MPRLRTVLLFAIGVLAVSAGIFYASGMRAVAKGQTPPRLPTARELSTQINRRWLKNRSKPSKPDDGTAGEA